MNENYDPRNNDPNGAKMDLKITVALSADVVANLDKLARANRVTRAFIIREAINIHINHANFEGK